MKRTMSPSARRDLVQHGLQPLLELAAILRAGDHRAEVERQQRLSFRTSGTSPLTMRSARPSTMAVLPTPGSPISTGLFLVRRRQHLDGAADLLVAADHRIELAVARRLGEVAGVLLERVVAVLGARRVGGAALAQLGDRLPSACGLTPAVGQRLGGVGALGEQQCQQHALGGDEAVAGLLGHLFGLVEKTRRLGRHVELARALAFDLGLLGQRRLDRAVHGAGVAACGGDQVGREAFRIVQQDFQEVVWNEALVPFAERQHLRALQEAAHAVRVLVLVHHQPFLWTPPINGRRKSGPLSGHPALDMGSNGPGARPDSGYGFSL